MSVLDFYLIILTTKNRFQVILTPNSKGCRLSAVLFLKPVFDRTIDMIYKYLTNRHMEAEVYTETIQRAGVAIESWNSALITTETLQLSFQKIAGDRKRL